MPDEAPTTWRFDLVDARADQEGNRLQVQPPFSYKLQGVDGQVKGGVRPSPGFQKVHTFNVTDWEPAASHNTTSRVLDVYPITFLTGAGYAYGFVYRVQRKNGGSSCDVFLDWWNTYDYIWRTGKVVMAGVALPRDLASPQYDGRQMSVAVAGKYIYVFLEGAEPVLCYVSNISPMTMTVETDTGPNRRPTILSPDETTGLGSLTTIDVADRSSTGQVVLLEYLPSEVPLGLTQADNDVRTLLAGNYGFAFRLRNSVTGRLSPLSSIAEARTADFDPAAYLGASSGTGTGATTGTGIGSGTDAQPLFAAIEICYRTANYDQALIYRSVRTQSAGGTFLGKILLLDKVIDLEDYWTVNNPGGGLRQSIYYYELDDIQLVSQEAFGEDDLYDEQMPNGGVAQWYDSCLLVSKLAGTAAVSSSDENRTVDPFRHLGELRWSTLVEWGPELFPPFNRYVPSTPSNDILAMRIVGPHVIGFSPDRQFLIRKETSTLKVLEIHEGYGIVGDKALDTVGTMVYYVTPKGVKTTDANGQLDEIRVLNKKIVEDWADSQSSISMAYDPTANVIFIHNRDAAEMACLWLNTEKMTEEVDCNFRHVTRGTWPYPFTFDEAALLDGGDKGTSNTDYKNSTREIAFFVKNPSTDSATQSSVVYPSLYVMDYGRQRTIGTGSGSGQTEYTKFPVGSDAVFEVVLVTSGGLYVFVDLTAGKSLTGNLNGMQLYVLEAADSTLVGNKATVRSTAGSTITVLVAEKAAMAGLVAGDVVGLSPINTEWSSGALSSQDILGNPTIVGRPGADLFTRKSVDTVGAYFTNVGGDEAGNTVARYQGLVFTGASDTPAEVADVVDPSGTIVTSVVDGEGIYEAAFGADTTGTYSGKHGYAANALSLGVRIICPNLDFRLTGVIADGRLLADRHGTPPSIGP